MVDLYTRDCLDVRPALLSQSVAAVPRASRAVQEEIRMDSDAIVNTNPRSFEDRIVQVRRIAFKEDFDTAVKPNSGAVRALSSYAIRPQSWSGYLGRDSSAPTPERVNTYSNQTYARLSARDTRTLQPNALKMHAATMRRGTWGASALSERSSISEPSAAAAVTSLLQRSLLLPVTGDSKSHDLIVHTNPFHIPEHSGPIKC